MTKLMLRVIIKSELVGNKYKTAKKKSDLKNHPL